MALPVCLDGYGSDGLSCRTDEVSLHSYTHVALRVERLQEAEVFYSELFALNVAWREAETPRGWYTLPEWAGWDDAERAGVELEAVMLFRDACGSRSSSPSRWPRMVHSVTRECSPMRTSSNGWARSLRQPAATSCSTTSGRSTSTIVRWELNTFSYDDPRGMSHGARAGHWLELSS
jgi:hypothetical protein